MTLEKAAVSFSEVVTTLTARGTNSADAVYPHVPNPSSGKVALLVVDDDPRILELVEHVARASQYFEPFTMAVNGRDALAKILAAERMPDVVLTDLSMPQMDGFEFVQALKRQPKTKHIPVVMFSSSGLIYDQQHALDAGCAAYFHKPSTFAGLRDVLENVVRITTQAEPASNVV